MLTTLWKMIAVAPVLALAVAMPGLADDTELYAATYTAGTTGKPKVLVIFDDSGSMTEIIRGVKPPYDPLGTYATAVSANRIYWSTSATPPAADSTQWFAASANSCAESYAILNQQGNFLATAAQYWQSASGSWGNERYCDGIEIFGMCFGTWRNRQVWQGTPAAWLQLSAAVNNPYSVECVNDATSSNPVNASSIGNGYPRAAVAADTANTGAYSATNLNNVTWSGGSRRFFTSHYMNWYYDNSIIPADKTYLQIAKDVIEDLVETNPSVDFGLAVFNDNTNSAANPTVQAEVAAATTAAVSSNVSSRI